LDFYAAQRAGATAIVRRADGAVVGWLVRGDDGLLRVRGRGDQLMVKDGEHTVASALIAFLRLRGWYVDDRPAGS